MIASDTAVLIDFINGAQNAKVEELAYRIGKRELFLPPSVITELYGIAANPNTSWQVIARELPTLEVTKGYWERAGKMRQLLHAKKYTARMSDVLIAQSCLDHGVPLITASENFRVFSKHCGLKLAKC